MVKNFHKLGQYFFTMVKKHLEVVKKHGFWYRSKERFLVLVSNEIRRRTLYFNMQGDPICIKYTVIFSGSAILES